MAIDSWPAHERPRERLLQLGASQLSDAELLAILFGHGSKRKNAVELARGLLQKYQSLRGIFTKDFRQLSQCHGVGAAKYCQIQAVAEISRRFLEETIVKTPLHSAADVSQFLLAKLRDYPQEVFACLFLDTKNHLICYEPLFYGSLSSASVYPREIARRALQHNAAAVIAAHNHPSGVATPSQADMAITLTLRDSLALLDIRLVDHIIIGNNQTQSLACLGLL